MDLDLLSDVVLGLLPTIGVTLLFGIAILAIVRADAGEREDRARIEAEEDAAAAAAGRRDPSGSSTAGSSAAGSSTAGSSTAGSSTAGSSGDDEKEPGAA